MSDGWPGDELREEASRMVDEAQNLKRDLRAAIGMVDLLTTDRDKLRALLTEAEPLITSHYGEEASPEVVDDLRRRILEAIHGR